MEYAREIKGAPVSQVCEEYKSGENYTELRLSSYKSRSLNPSN